MQVSKDVALKVWALAFGSKEWAVDCFGYLMNVNDYGDFDKSRSIGPNGHTSKAYSYGWSIDHIKPTASNGPDDMNNYEPMWHGNNAEKSDRYPGFKIDSKNYTVITYRTPRGDTAYGIQDVSTGLRVDWKKDGKYFY
jgi:hypothetical protein